MIRRMRRIRKVLPFLLTFSMCMNLFCGTTLAAMEESRTETTTSSTDDDGNTTTETTTETSWSDSSSSSDSESGSDSTSGSDSSDSSDTGSGDDTNSDAGSGDSSDVGSDSESGDSSDFGDGADTGSDADSSDSDDSDAGADTGNNTSSETTTTVTGQETTVDTTVTDKDGNIVQESEHVSGSQTTVTDTTETKTDTKQDVLVGETTDESASEPTAPGYSESETSGEWTEQGTVSGPKTEGELKPETPTDKVPEKPEENKKTDAELSGVTNPLDKEQITITLKPGSSENPNVNSVKKEVSMEEILAGNIEIPDALKGNPNGYEETSADGSVTTTYTPIYSEKDGTTIIGYEVVTTTKTVSGPSASDKKLESVNAGAVTSTPTAPEGYTPGSKTEPVTDDSGEVIGEKTTTTEEIRDKDGNVIGYQITTTTTTNNSSTTTNTDIDKTPTTDTKVEESISLPEKPAESDATDTDGNRTTVKVVDIVEDGQTVGYKVITTTVSADGKNTSISSKNLYGTVTTTTTTTTTPTREDVTTGVTTVVTEVTTIKGYIQQQEIEKNYSQEITFETTYVEDSKSYQIVETDDGIYFLYEGKMWQVLEGEGHGTTKSDSLTPDLTGPAAGTYDKINDLYGRGPSGKDDVNMPSGTFYWDGTYGLESAIRVLEGKSYQAHQFVLTDKDGNKHYVYCADFNVAPNNGAYYEMENIENAGYYKRDDAAGKIYVIAENGYWGTESGLGSLDKVKELLTNSGHKDIADKLTAGEALAATQAAIWKYGNSGEAIGGNIVGKHWDGKNWTTVDASSKARVEVLYNLLIGLDPTKDKINESTTVITDKNFATEAAIVIKDKATDEQGNVKKDEAGNEKYDTNVSFTLQMTPSSQNDDLIVTVIDEKGNPIATKRLAGDDSSTNYGTITPAKNEKGENVYTITDLQIAAGVKITLNLSGTQKLDPGVYLYTATGGYNSSQSFVGIAEGHRNVNLNVDLCFDVVEPEAEKQETTGTNKWTQEEKRTDTWTETTTQTRENTQTETTTQTEQSITIKKEFFADMTITEVIETEQTVEEEWERFNQNDYNFDNSDTDNGGNNNGNGGINHGNGGLNNGIGDSNDSDSDAYRGLPDNAVALATLTDGAVPLANMSGDGDDDAPLLEMFDQEVPLANLPATRDNSGIWHLLFALSTAGLVLLGVTGKKRSK